MAIVCTPVASAVDPVVDLSDLCGHTPEQFAEVALALEPSGIAWCKDFWTVKAALYRAFGSLLSGFEQRLCYLFTESTGCSSVELLSEFELDYGLPGTCAVGSYPTDLKGRQARVCAVRKSTAISTNAELQAILRLAMQCDYLTVTNAENHFYCGQVCGLSLTQEEGVCISGIGLGEPEHSPECEIVQHVTASFGVGSTLTIGNQYKLDLLACLMSKYMPAHVTWNICP